MRRSIASVQVLRVDPELASGIAGGQLALACGRAVAPLLVFQDTGTWMLEEHAVEPAGHLGLLIVEGVLARSVSVGPRGGVELLGPGDVLRPWVRSELAQPGIDWKVIEPLQVASLDSGFSARIAPWPTIRGEISDRLLLRARALAFQVAVCHLVTVEERLLMMLWHFAQRWGRVTPHGVVVRLPLTHELLAGIVGARRPPVSTALGALTGKDRLRRGPGGVWTLRGAPPQSFAELRRELATPLEPHAPAADADAERPTDPGAHQAPRARTAGG
jgi:hypothetical protein